MLLVQKALRNLWFITMLLIVRQIDWAGAFIMRGSSGVHGSQCYASGARMLI